MDTQVLRNLTFPAVFIMFLFIYLFAYFVVFRSWGPKQRTEASSCLMSLAHGTPAVILAIHSLSHTQTSLSFASPNSNLDNRVLEFSMAYFSMDLLHYLVFVPDDALFILHHLATLYVFLTCRYVVRHGAYGILVLLILAEITSACQNVRSIASFRRVDVPAAAKLYEFLSPPFYALYSVVRGVLGPLFVFKMGMFYLSGKANGSIPSWAYVSWLVVIGTAILVSILWVWSNWVQWYRERSNQVQQKLR